MSEAEDVPAPDLRLRSDPPPVMRLSHKALAVIGTVAGTAIGGSLIYALAPSHKEVPAELLDTNSHARADALAGAPKDYAQVPKLGPPLPGDLGRPIVSAQQRGDDVTVPPIGAPAPTPARPMASPAANAAQVALARGRQERDSARTSKLFLASPAAGAGGSAGAVSAALAMMPGSAGAATPTPAAAGAGDDDQSHKRAFIAGGAQHSPVSAARLEPVASPYVLQAGSIIQAALITGLRSDLPGQVTAQVTANVFDSLTGKLLLIPQGSKLIGEYDSSVSFGQSRVLLAWTRLILPDGRSLQLEREPSADVGGFAGVQDGVNYHWGGVAKAALLSTVLGIGAQVGGSGDDELLRAVRQGTSDTVNQAGQQIVRRQLNVQPTLTVRSGYPVRVIVTHDLVLAPAGKE